MFEAGDIRQRRAELNMWQSELAAKVGVDKRQIRRYESGEAKPTLPIAKAIASALGITIDELAGQDTHRINLTGDWWACWQPWKDGTEVLNCHQISIQQHGDKLSIATTTRGTQAYEEGGYLWEGELRLWDNEILMGLVRRHRGCRPPQRHYVVCDPPARREHDRPLGRPRLRRADRHRMGNHHQVQR
jgi:DNA-binding XRE family transcriptional regulator